MASAAGSKMMKLSPNIRELRLHLCQKSGASEGVRKFIRDHYVTLKESNPKLPILIRECSGINPKIYCRFGYGYEEMEELTDKSHHQVLETLKSFK